MERAPGTHDHGAAHRPAQRYRVKRRFGRELAIADKNLGLEP